MNLKVKEIIVKHKIFTFPGEQLAGKSISECTFCDDDGVELEVITHFSHSKGNVFPESLYYLAFGCKVKEKDVWAKYRSSSTIIFLICK